VGSVVRRFADLDALSRAAAEDFVALAREAVTARGAFHVALSGGSTPKRMFQLLAAMGKGALPWDRIDLWWGDERTVPPDHPDSNYRMTREALLDPLALTRFHRIVGELDQRSAHRPCSISPSRAWAQTVIPRRYFRAAQRSTIANTGSSQIASTRH
jgi:6-phosphogluconolactonase